MVNDDQTAINEDRVMIKQQVIQNLFNYIFFAKK